MREIKFRAWSKVAQQIITWNEIDAMGKLSKLVNSDYPLMQYTGLKDKNDVEIYEGDIVLDHIGTGVVEYKDKYAAFRVNYTHDKQAKWFLDYLLHGERESIEIIGNIYQHPELLEAGK